jgi:hypothetical protein
MAAPPALPTHRVRFDDLGSRPLDGTEFTITIRPGTVQAMSAQASREIGLQAAQVVPFAEIWFWPDGDVALADLDGTTGSVLGARGVCAGRFTVTAIPADNALEGSRLTSAEGSVTA